MIPLVAAILCGCALSSTGMTRWMIGYAKRRNMIDAVNERSSHSIPTPRGGGLAIVVATLVGLVAAQAAIGGNSAVLFGLAGGGIGVAAIGWIDDKGHIDPVLRLGVHLLAGAWLMWWVGGPGIQRIGAPFAVQALVAVAMVLMIAWIINLYNFMDGIDGLAASEAVAVSLGGSLIFLASGAATLAEAAPALLLAAAALGFLPWNWPPASIFMGDASSGFLGFLIGATMLIAAGRDPVQGVAVVLLLGTFLADTGVTLTVRLLSGRPVHQAHRSHAYQILARRWRSHRRVTLANLAVTICWLGPLAIFVDGRSVPPVAALVVGLSPLALLAWKIGAGRENT